MALKALAFNCTLKLSPAPSSTEKLLQELFHASSEHEVTGEIVRTLDTTSSRESAAGSRNSADAITLKT